MVSGLGDFFMAAVDRDGNVRFVYRNPICQDTGGNCITRFIDGSTIISSLHGVVLSWESPEGEKILYRYDGNPPVLVSVLLPNNTRLCSDKDHVWYHLNAQNKIVCKLEGQAFVSPDGRLWLRGGDGVFRPFELPPSV